MPESKNWSLFGVSRQRDVVVLRLFNPCLKPAKLVTQSREIERGPHVGIVDGLLLLRYDTYQKSDPYAKDFMSCPIWPLNRMTSKLSLLQPQIGLTSGKANFPTFVDLDRRTLQSLGDANLPIGGPNPIEGWAKFTASRFHGFLAYAKFKFVPA